MNIYILKCKFSIEVDVHSKAQKDCHNIFPETQVERKGSHEKKWLFEFKTFCMMCKNKMNSVFLYKHFIDKLKIYWHKTMIIYTL